MTNSKKNQYIGNNKMHTRVVILEGHINTNKFPYEVFTSFAKIVDDGA